jgi:competence protein ComEA
MFVVAAALALVSTAVAAQKSATPAAAAPASGSEVINLNTATVTQLSTLPGIGQKTAELIVQYRQKNGGFKKIEEIMNVRGIGEKSFLKIKSRLTVTPPKAN